jgi:hypothetical protein
LKLIALAALAWVPIYLLDGTSAEGPAGTPVGFASSLRHLLPSLVLALVLVPLLAARWSRPGRIAAALLLAVMLVAADSSGVSWPRNYVLLAAILGALGLAAVALRQFGLGRWLPRPALAVACVAAIGALAAGGWFLQRSYLRDRYRTDAFRSQGLNAAFKWASGLHDQRITTSLILLYPLFGTDISNRVEYLGMRVPHGGFIRPRTCAEWLNVVNGGHYDYLVVSDPPGGDKRDRAKELAQTNARLVLERKLIDVFRLDGPIGRSTCSSIYNGPARRSAAAGHRS